MAHWVAQQPAWRPVKGNPQPLPSEAWLNLTRTAAAEPLYENQPERAITTLQTLADAAPRDAGLQIALGDAQRLDGQHRRTELTLKHAETLEPHNAELISTQGLNALALQEWTQARELAAWATARYPENQATRRLADALEDYDKHELQVTTRAARATDSPVSGSRDLIMEAVLYSAPIRENWRLFGAGGYATADFEEGTLNHRWIRAGAQWRSRDLTLEADVSGQNYGYGNRTGARLAATYTLSDDWEVGAALAWRPPDASLRTLKNNITTRRADVWVKYGSSTPEAAPPYTPPAQRGAPLSLQAWPHNHYLALAWHDVEDDNPDQTFVSVSTTHLQQQFAWLRENHYQPVSVDQILQTVSTTKTIFSYEIRPSVFKFVNFKDLLEIEAGVTRNEPAQLAVKEAIEAAVIYLTVRGLKDRQWTLANEADWQHPVIQNYMKEETSYAALLEDAGTGPTAEGSPPAP